MSKRIVIGFSGPMGVGKSTAIAVIQKVSGQANVALNKFAQPLYNIQEAAYKEIEAVYKRPLDFVKDRKFLQWLGTEWGRDTISKTLWVDLWQARTRLIQEASPGAIVVCDDVRFDNEGEAIKALGGFVVQLVGPSRIEDKGIKAHASENGIKPEFIDYVIHNESSKDKFEEKIELIYSNILDSV